MLVNSWNLLPIIPESSNLDVEEVLDMLLVPVGYVCE